MAVGIFTAVRAGFPARRSALALTSAVVTILLGSKLLYLLELHFFPLDDYVPDELRGSLHGFRIPGGILLLALTTVPVCRALGLPWRRFGDLLIPLAAAGLVLVRLGCFLNGCCFGRVSSVRWAMTFPSESWVFWYHRARGWITPTATASLPVHPLQLYFLFAAALTFAVLLGRQMRQPQPGSQQLVFYTLFFGTIDPDDPYSVCQLLDDERTMMVISGAGERALRWLCGGLAHRRDLQSNPAQLLSLLPESFERFLRPAIAQPGPNIRANNPAPDPYPMITQNEVSIGISGQDQNIIVTGYNDTSHFDTDRELHWILPLHQRRRQLGRPRRALTGSRELQRW